MRIKLDGWAHLPKEDLDAGKQAVIRDSLTIIPRKTSEHQEVLLPLRLYDEDAKELRVPREWFLDRRTTQHAYELNLGDGDPIPEDRARIAETYVTPEGETRRFGLRAEQQAALEHVLGLYKQSFRDIDEIKRLGTSLQAPTGWGKTIWAAAVISAVSRKTLVLVHKEFLTDQWCKRLRMVMPGIRVGVIQENRADLDADVCVGMLQSLSNWADEMKKAGPGIHSDLDWQKKVRFPPSMGSRFGLIISDEEHRMGAPTWVPVCPLFNARFRVGLTATPRRKDGCADAFFWHLGPIGFQAKEKRLIPKVKRVQTHFRVWRQDRDADTLPRSVIEKFLCASEARNRLIAEMICEAVKAGRKILLLSDKLKHLDRIEGEFEKIRAAAEVDVNARVDRYVGGRKKHELEHAGLADVILATYQMAAEGLDLPWVDTLFLATPKSDVEQATGRILRPFEGKKEPIVVDFRDDELDDFKRMGLRRDEFFDKLLSSGPGLTVRRATG